MSISVVRRILVAAVLSAFLELETSASSSCRPYTVAGYYSGYTCELTETGVGSIPENSTALRLLSTESTRGATRGHNLTLPRLPVLQVLEYDVTGGQNVLPERPFVQLPHLDILQLFHRASSKDDFRFVLRAGIFEGLNSLRRLILSDLGLGDLPVGALEGLDNLRILELNHNRLFQVPAGIFASCRNLGILTLSRNQISDLGLVSRQGLSELRTLDLSGNNLTALNEEDFTGLENIVGIDLSNNAIQRIDERAWRGLRKLEVIHLDGNRLNFSQQDSVLDHNQGNCRGPFCELSSVKKLNTSHNVSCLPPFSGELVSLKKLYLSGNNIDSLLYEHFACLRRLEELNLSRNHIRSLSRAFRIVFNRLGYIDLSSNPWHCDCDMYWIAKWLTSIADDAADNLEDTKCATPVANQILTEAFVNRSTECGGGGDEETAEETEYWSKRQTTSDHETTDNLPSEPEATSDDDHISTAESTLGSYVTSEKDPPSGDIIGSTPQPTLQSVTEDIRTLDAELVTEITNLEQMKTCDVLLSSVKDTMKTLDSLLQRTTANIDTLNRLLLTTIDNVEHAAVRDRTSTESSVAIGQRNSVNIGYQPNRSLLLLMVLTVCGFVRLFGFK